jgi:hypothetical protein
MIIKNLFPLTKRLWHLNCILSGLLGFIRIGRRNSFCFKSLYRRELSVDVRFIAHAT